MENIGDYVTKVTMAPPQRRNVYRADKTGILTVAAVACTVRIEPGLNILVNVYAKSKGRPESFDDIDVSATMPQGIDASDNVKAAFLAHVASYVAGWSGWADAANAAFNALHEWSDKPASKIGAGGLDVKGFGKKPQTDIDAGN